ncbi:MAG: ABC transporter ATP-binding protein [Chloroflexi bacterium]|nr:ABC transporter ATP-binding protein [Chloroflexota bacterium]
MIHVRDVTKEFNTSEGTVRALDQVTLEIPRGSVVTLMGPSGSGKTTLLNMISGLDKPTSGTISVDKRVINTLTVDELNAFRRKIGFVFQRFALIPTASAYENMEYALRISDIPRQEWDARIMQTLAQLDMREHAHHRPGELSGGQQQRVAVARALAISPQIIIADEPTANLDAQRGAAVLGLLRELGSQHITVVISTHDPVATKYATHICKMRGGHIESFGPINDGAL